MAIPAGKLLAMSWPRHFSGMTKLGICFSHPPLSLNLFLRTPPSSNSKEYLVILPWPHVNGSDKRMTGRQPHKPLAKDLLYDRTSGTTSHKNSRASCPKIRRHRCQSGHRITSVKCLCAGGVSAPTLSDFSVSAVTVDFCSLKDWQRSDSALRQPSSANLAETEACLPMSRS